MRIVDFDALPHEMWSQVQLLDLSAGWGMVDLKAMLMATKLGYPSADYFGVFAVEKGEVLSTVRVTRIPYTLPNRRKEDVSAIGGVITRQDHSGQGLARKLLKEVHRREKADGSRFSLLWTGRNNIAHHLYASLGYVDIHTPELAMVKCMRKPDIPSNQYSLEKARNRDAKTIEQIHSDATKNRVGFTPRVPGLLGIIFKLGWVRPELFRLILHDNKIIGYCELQKSHGWTRSSEIVVAGDKAEDEQVIPLLEREAGNGWLVLGSTFVRDNYVALKSRGYSIASFAYITLMALSLDGTKSQDTARLLGAEDAGFVCHRLDSF
ncbi:MAG: GNAT family N-acetyltransferase [Candidatus Bathyarchaeia archaeon]